jgi:alpha-beta hydrolase superfamily lysophospholipase
MQPSDLRGLGRLAGLALAGGVTRVEEMHTSIAGRAFGGVGPASAPVHVVHDTVARGVYTAVRGTLSYAVTAAGRAAGSRGSGAPLDDHPRGRAAIAVLNGGYGDLLEREVPELATAMGLRQHGRALAVRREPLAAAYPAATGRLAVFLHGLVETERAWRFGAARRHGDPEASYGALLRRDLGYTPIWVRYNTGLRISRNGHGLASLLDELVAAWPVPVTDVVLIGHSMGGLVVRSAVHQAAHPDQGPPARWLELTRATVTLGTPHLGAPAEKAANVATHALGLVGETRPLAALLAMRSVGIKDLRYGNLVEADWHGHDPDALLRDTRTDIPLHDGVRHFAVLATLLGSHRNRAGALVGDLLVRPHSAAGDTGRENRLAFPDTHVARLQGLHHLDLLNHPRVYRYLRTWLAGLGEPPAPVPLSCGDVTDGCEPAESGPADR